MENYMKAVLYAYPLLKTVEEDYVQHIKNKALLSYNSRLTTEALAEYLAEEILHKNRLVWLKEIIEKTVARLPEHERVLLGIRYFGKKREREFAVYQQKGLGFDCNERQYFRLQKRLSEKISGMLHAAGVTKTLFDNELAEIELFRKIYRYIEKRQKSEAEGQNSSVS